MIEPLKMLLNTTASDGRKTHPLSDLLGQLTASVEQLGKFMSIIGPNYDSGDFCKGLMVSYYGKQFVLDVKENFVSSFFELNNQ